MTKKVLWGLLISALILLFLIPSCTTTSTTSTANTPEPSSTAAVTTTAPATQANWWDKFGEPVYGGKLNVASGALMGMSFDLYSFAGAEVDLWYETLFEPSWTVDRKVWSFTGMFYPDEYWQGNLAQSWEVTNPTTITAHLRQGVHWQNKAPVNGREFVAGDVQFHYDRMLGTGSGYLYGNPMYLGMAGNLDKVTAADKYTVVFKFKQPSAQNFQTIADRFALNELDAPEWVALGGPPVNEPPAAPAPGPPGPPAAAPLAGGPLTDWKQVVGTGPWMFTDFVAGSSLTFSKNPDYWAMDERHPKNKLPYADSMAILIIPDSSTRLAALRTGQIDSMNSGTGGLQWQDQQQVAKSNPEIQIAQVPAGASGIGLRVDVAPFSDINVRIALDMAIDRGALAKGFYGGTSATTPVGFVTAAYKGYAYNYTDWPQSLKDQYAFNPEGAKKLLADSGFPNGFKTNVVCASTAVQTQLLEVMKALFKDIGVELEIRSMDPTAEQAFVRDAKHDQSAAQGLAFTWPPTRLIDTYYSKTIGDCVFYGLNNAPDNVYDTLHDQMLAATDPPEAQKIFQQMDKRIIEQHYTIAAPETYSYMVWQPWLKGYSGEVLQWGQGIAYARMWKTAK
jgi:peptide/nickel transport system substrate-binding protein